MPFFPFVVSSPFWLSFFRQCLGFGPLTPNPRQIVILCGSGAIACHKPCERRPKVSQMAITCGSGVSTAHKPCERRPDFLQMAIMCGSGGIEGHKPCERRSRDPTDTERVFFGLRFK